MYFMKGWLINLIIADYFFNYKYSSKNYTNMGDYMSDVILSFDNDTMSKILSIIIKTFERKIIN